MDELLVDALVPSGDDRPCERGGVLQAGICLMLPAPVVFEQGDQRGAQILGRTDRPERAVPEHLAKPGFGVATTAVPEAIASR